MKNSEKKPFEKPVLKEVGTLSEVVKGGTGGPIADGLNTFISG